MKALVERFRQEKKTWFVRHINSVPAWTKVLGENSHYLEVAVTTSRNVRYKFRIFAEKELKIFQVFVPVSALLITLVLASQTRRSRKKALVIESF